MAKILVRDRFEKVMQFKWNVLVKFEWDNRKNRQYITKHGSSFEDAHCILFGFATGMVDGSPDYDEMRGTRIGMIDGLTVATVFHMDRAGVCRMISARRANRTARRRYE